MSKQDCSLISERRVIYNLGNSVPNVILGRISHCSWQNVTELAKYSLRKKSYNLTRKSRKKCITTKKAQTNAISEVVFLILKNYKKIVVKWESDN